MSHGSSAIPPRTALTDNGGPETRRHADEIIASNSGRVSGSAIRYSDHYFPAKCTSFVAIDSKRSCFRSDPDKSLILKESMLIYGT